MAVNKATLDGPTVIQESVSNHFDHPIRVRILLDFSIEKMFGFTFVRENTGPDVEARQNPKEILG